MPVGNSAAAASSAGNALVSKGPCLGANSMAQPHAAQNHFKAIQVAEDVVIDLFGSVAVPQS